MTTAELMQDRTHYNLKLHELAEIVCRSRRTVEDWSLGRIETVPEPCARLWEMWKRAQE